MMPEIYEYWNDRTPFTWGNYAEMREKRYQLAEYLQDSVDFSRWGNKRVLEIGAGSGIDSIEFARHGAHVYSTDLTDKAIQHIQDYAKQSNMTLEDIRKVDGTRIPYTDSFFDLVYSLGVIHHVPQPRPMIEEFYRVLKPGGLCYLVVYHKNSLLYHYSIIWLRGVVQGGFLKGYSEEYLLSQYSEGKEGCPYTKAYTVGEAKRLFSPSLWSKVDITIEYPVVDTLEKRKEKMPCLPKHLGWHLVIQAVKR